ncbi:hypothetical protein T484DRAFT_1757571 [Baffinella frigidus]|nr:hypothetical protein T484DRAFT_1757571 [Cryptophyta sp. CCMP2293]
MPMITYLCLYYTLWYQEKSQNSREVSSTKLQHAHSLMMSSGYKRSSMGSSSADEALGDPVPGPPATGGVRTAKSAKRCLSSYFNPGPAGGAAPADSVIVPGTPSSGESDDGNGAPSADLLRDTAVRLSPPQSFRPIAVPARVPPGAVVFVPDAAPARDPRLAPLVARDPRLAPLVARDPRLAPLVARDPRLAPLVALGPLLVPGIRASLVKRVEDFIVDVAEPPPKHPSEAPEVDDSEALKRLRARAEFDASSSKFLLRTKRALYHSLDREIDMAHGEIHTITNLCNKLHQHMSYDIMNIENMHAKMLVSSEDLIESDGEWGAIVAGQDIKIKDLTEYITRLDDVHLEAIALVKTLFLDLQSKTSAASDAAATAKGKHLSVVKQLEECQKGLVDTNKKFGQSSEVLQILKQTTVIPYCGKCLAQIDSSQTFFKMTCGKLRCDFCKNGDVCKWGICEDVCQVAYMTNMEDYLSEIRFTRKHVLDNYPRGVVNFQDKYEEPPEFLADYRREQHKLRSNAEV